MGEYQLKTYVFFIYKDGCDIVFGVEWICKMGLVTMDFKELYMSFTKKVHVHTLQGI